MSCYLLKYFNSLVSILPEEQQAPSSFIPVIIMAGQSNADGRAEIQRAVNEGNYTNRDPVGMFIYHKPTVVSTDNGSWEPMNVRAANSGGNILNPGFFQSNDFYGVEWPLSTLLRSYIGRDVYVIKYAQGATQLQQGAGVTDWSENSTGELYEQLTQWYFTPAITKLQADNPGVEIRVLAFFWWQGERDGNQGFEASYQTNFTNFMAAVRGYNTLLTDVPFIATKLDFYRTAAEATVNSAFQTLANNPDNNLYVVDAAIPANKQKDELTTQEEQGVTGSSDDNHSSYISVNSVASQAFNILSQIIEGDTSGLPLLTQEGDDITMT